MMRRFLLITTLFLYGTVSAQRIADFQMSLVDGSVIIKFYITPGPSCSGFTVLHSTDSLQFNDVYNDPGICGNQPVKEAKAYTHEAPVAGQKNFYRIRLEPYVEMSDAKGIYVKASSSEDLLLYPNPQTAGDDGLRVLLADKTLSRVRVRLCHYQGADLGQLDLNRVGDNWFLPTANLPNGLYLLRFVEPFQKKAHKFVILR